jgi:Uma2 family endonuclease
LGGKVVFSRFAFRLSDYRAPEPDLAYIRPDRIHLAERGFMPGPPDIAVEIVAEESRARDYVEKRSLYEQAGVQEYWIIDQQKRVPIFWHCGTARSSQRRSTATASSTAKSCPASGSM